MRSMSLAALVALAGSPSRRNDTANPLRIEDTRTMRSLALCRCAVSISAVAALLVGCGGSRQLIGASGAVPQASTLAAGSSSTSYKIVYSFGAPPDGNSPVGSLIDVGGTLYGTTVDGGSYSNCRFYYQNCGTVFSITPSGTEKVLHSFGAGSDGRFPFAGLIDVGGTLYGTTGFGGSHSYCNYSSYNTCGTVFSITPTGTEKVLHSFNGGDGGLPKAGLIDVKGTLYGTTSSGGQYFCYSSIAYACGTVFSLTTTGTEGVLYNFRGRPYGAFPTAGLIDVQGTLYGTTGEGGKHGSGTVFSITTSGALKVLHSFGAGSDGRYPDADLIELRGKLYGTTRKGGAYSCNTSGGQGCGTVFSVTPDGKEKVLHSFGNGADGAHPHASLIELKGTLYGTTINGGGQTCGSNAGCGTVFSITPGGTEKVLYSFAGSAARDGANPQSGLTDVHGTLYGTTESGGAHFYGTVFSLKP